MKKFVFALLLILVVPLNTACDKEVVMSTETTETKATAQTVNTVETVSTELKIEEKLSEEYPRVITPNVENIDFAIQNEDIFLINADGKFGYISADGIEIAPYEYEFATPFNDGVALVKNGNKYGFIDKDGKEYLPFIYDNASPFSEGLAYFEIGDKYGFINKQGEEVLLLDFDSISSFNEGLAYFSNGGKYGYIDKNGKVVIDNVYDDASYFENGLAVVRKGGNYGCINKDGKTIIPFEYSAIYSDEEKINCVNFETDENVYYDFDGNIIKNSESVEPKQIFDEKDFAYIGNYDGIIVLSENLVSVIKDGEAYLYNVNGKMISEKAYQTIHNYGDTIVFELNDKDGIMDKNGNEIVPAKYDYIHRYNLAGSKNCIMASNYDGENKDSIIVLDKEDENIENNKEKHILKNQITPKIKIYGDYAKENNIVIDDSEISRYNTFTLLNAEGFEKPLLSVYNAPLFQTGFPMSDSAFYTNENNEIKEVINGYESGGSMRGVVTCLFFEKESGKTFVGTDGAYSGFGGYAIVSEVVTSYKDDKKLDFMTLEQPINQFEYDNDFLLKNANKFYSPEIYRDREKVNENKNLTQENITNNDIMQTYFINDELVLKEEYNEKINRYKLISVNLYE